METHGRRCTVAFDTREIRACREWQAGAGSSRFLSPTHATKERDVGAKEDVSCIEVQWIEYSIFSAPGRSEDRRRLARAPARPEDPTKAAYWPRALARLASSQMFRRQAHKSLNPHKRLLRFTDEFLPSLRCISRELFFRHVRSTSAIRSLTARWYFIASIWPARSNHSCIIPSTRPLSSEPRKLFIDGVDVKRITT